MAVEVLILRKIMETMAKEVSPLIVKLSQEKAEYAIYDPLVGGIIPASNIQGEK
jgi:fructose/tagatose bisphosphate aldolase